MRVHGHQTHRIEELRQIGDVRDQGMAYPPPQRTLFDGPQSFALDRKSHYAGQGRQRQQRDLLQDETPRE